MIVPVKGARVRVVEDGPPGVVRGVTGVGDDTKVIVEWEKGRVSHEVAERLRPDLPPGWEVVYRSPTSSGSSDWHGVVEQCRKVAGRHQVLVDFWSRAERVWLPWEHLVATIPVKHRFLKAVPPRGGDAEAFRLRNLAFALEQWHANTGALTRLEIDPLPHQIHLVHRIITSGNLNWLIADDVGLGKTIEVGLLLSALRTKRQERFLLVVPAGLTRQWKEEMADKFGLEDFFIYGEDVLIDQPSQWKLFDRVIVSLDRLKREEHLRNVLQAGRWDLVVFDEAHWLGREEFGRRIKATDRYRAADALRPRTDAMLLLTGTPHQGKDDRFRALLELLRPDEEWKKRFRRIRQEPEMLRELVIRNRKADVTDAEGTFIFRGKDVRTVRVPTSDEAADFDSALRGYVTRGYEASTRSGPSGQAIGFVMTTYRKLAASSHAAIAKALERRMTRLEASESIAMTSESVPEDERFVDGDEYRAEVVAPASEFFRGEKERLRPLVHRARRLAEDDRKLQWFLDEVVKEVKREDPLEKLLVFTEYRTTQDHVAKALRERYGSESVVLIHGGQSFGQRRRAIDAFEGGASFLVSTEAGGEGLNLHRACHVMVNYDLPWNPMRLVQRVGRLYRYGQDKRVQVVNLHAPDSLDHTVLHKMYDKLESVAADMAAVGDEYSEGRDALREDILGELVGSLDVVKLLESSDLDENRSEERLDEAIRKAREATERQDEILRHASGYDPGELSRDLRLGREHLIAFAEGACKRAGVEISARRYDGTVWDLVLPERLQKRVRSRSKHVRIAFERSQAARLDGGEMFGPDHPLYRAFSEAARRYGSGGHGASIQGLDGRAAMGALLRWLDDRGRPLYHEYVGIVLRRDGGVDMNHGDWADFLMRPASDGPVPSSPSVEDWKSMVLGVERELARRASDDVHPDSPYRLGVAWLEELGANASSD